MNYKRLINWVVAITSVPFAAIYLWAGVVTSSVVVLSLSLPPILSTVNCIIIARERRLVK